MLTAASEAPRRAVTVIVLMCSWAGTLQVPVARADETIQHFAGVTCAAGRCDAEAKRVRRPEADKVKAGTDHGRGAPKAGATGATGKRAPSPLPTLVSTGWEADLGGGFGILPRFDGVKQTAKPKSGGEPQVPLETVVQRAVQRLTLPDPVIRTSPDTEFVQVVHVPTWMWVERSTWGPVSVTAAVEGVSVTATARPRRAVWSMGEGGRVVCRGPGTPYSSAYDPGASSPDCGYTYRRASVGRSGGAFTVSVEVFWDVEWQGGGQTGVVPGQVKRAQRQLVVDEVQAVAVR